jgi:bifunctional oligoribonuclease and PAP phosphatase NrnA
LTNQRNTRSTSKNFSTAAERNTTETFLRLARELADLLGHAKRVLIASHRSPDGDAVASVLAGAEMIRSLGSEPLCAIEGGASSRYGFLPGVEALRAGEKPPERSFHCVLVLDCGSLPRIGKVAEWIKPDHPLVNVDHHRDNVHFGTLNLVYPEAASTTEILFDLLRALQLPLTASLAVNLYTGLLTDTGGFRFPNTSPRCFQMAAELSAAGGDPGRIADSVYRVNSAAGVKLLGEALNSLEVVSAGRLAILTIQEPDASKELEDVTDFALTVRGVRAAVFFRTGKDEVRVSLRIRGSGDVACIARRYVGGGHQKAAGFTVKGSIGDVRAGIIAALCEELDHPTASDSNPA